LLKNEFGIFSLFDNPPKKGTQRALHSCPKSHSRSSSDSDVKFKNDDSVVNFTPFPALYDDLMYVRYVQAVSTPRKLSFEYNSSMKTLPR
jgi:hypothetical protein